MRVYLDTTEGGAGGRGGAGGERGRVEVEGSSVCHHGGGAPRYPGTKLSCESRSDYWGAGTAMRSAYGGGYQGTMKAAISQVTTLMNGIIRDLGLTEEELQRAYDSTGRCSHPPVKCRKQTYEAAVAKKPMPACTQPKEDDEEKVVLPTTVGRAKASPKPTPAAKDKEQASSMPATVGRAPSTKKGQWLWKDALTPTKKATGGGLPVEVWSRFMKAAHQGVPVAAIPNSQGSWAPANLMQISSQITAPSGPAAPF